jgi:hypothetical protein
MPAAVCFSFNKNKIFANYEQNAGVDVRLQDFVQLRKRGFICRLKTEVLQLMGELNATLLVQVKYFVVRRSCVLPGQMSVS